ncbi:MAG: glycosyltransferase family 9 protein [Lentisphaerae bacterium]|nr:glycosyltransferase family 9 protein [Lentisphaerota bacterium]
MENQTPSKDHKPDADPSVAPRQVLIVKMSSLGDLFHALPAVHILKTSLAAEIDWVVQQEYVELVHCFQDVRRVLGFPRRRPARLPEFFQRLRATHYDLIIDLQGLLKSAMVAKAASGDRRIGPSFQREGARWFYGELAGSRNINRHAVEQVCDIITHLGLSPAPAQFPVSFPPVDPGGAPPRVALSPFSRWPTKNWPMQNFVELGRTLQKRANATLFILGGQPDARACARLAAEIGGATVNLAGRLTLPELGGWLSAMQLLITNDSGPMHMAAAAGTPVLAFFGPTDPHRTGPYGPGHIVLQSKLLCRPCRTRRCRFGDVSCLSAITPEMAGNAALPMLARYTKVNAGQ